MSYQSGLVVYQTLCSLVKISQRRKTASDPYTFRGNLRIFVVPDSSYCLFCEMDFAETQAIQPKSTSNTVVRQVGQNEMRGAS